MKNAINIIFKDKKSRTEIILFILLIFIFTIGYSLSFFGNNSNNKIALIKVNNLSFNMTTNSSESDDRILHLQAGKIEDFNIVLKNLNNINVKYEIFYELCDNSNCVNTSKNIPNDLLVYKESNLTKINGSLESNQSNNMTIVTKNNSSKDYYIKLNLNVGYNWNDLDLLSQIDDIYSNNTYINVYVDGVKMEQYPDDCSYNVEAKAYKNDKEVNLDNISITCDKTTKMWKTKFTGLINKLDINFTSIPFTPTTFAEDSWDVIAKVIKYSDPTIYAVGSEKEIEIDGKSYTARVANNTTPSECSNENFSQTACGFVVEFVDIPETRVMNSTATNVGGWPASELRTYANGEFFNKLPSDLQNVIIDTKVISGHGTTSGEDNFVSTDKIFLLSAKEIWNSNPYDTAINNSRQLDYFKSKGVTSTNYSAVIKVRNNKNTYWWLRTSYSNNNSSFLFVYGTGSYNQVSATSLYSFAPVFRIG